MTGVQTCALPIWKAEGGDVTLGMMSGLTLVASSPAHGQTDTMNNMIAGELGSAPLKSETYNIGLLTFNHNILQVGDSVRLSLGFPLGYGPNDEGVTFKAYHFKRDEYGEIIGLEEIPCIVTRYGLVIQCTSFSPFAVAAVPDNGAPKTSKSIILSNTQGGRILGDVQGIFTLGQGQEKQLTIQADSGYVIDAVLVGGKYQKITNNKSMAVTAKYGDLADGDIIEAQFVADLIQQRFGIESFLIIYVGPVIGAHSGPGTIALFYMGEYL